MAADGEKERTGIMSREGNAERAFPSFKSK